jgi:hypothetical protein
MRYFLFLVVVAGFTTLLIRSCSVDMSQRRGPTRIPTYSWGEMRDIFAQEDELDDRVRRMQLFRNVLLDTERALLARSLPLTEAVDAVSEAARQNNPAFLLHMEARYRGMTVREQVALTLLLRLTLAKSEGSLTSEEELVVDRLRCELIDWPGSSAALREQLGINDR